MKGQSKAQETKDYSVIEKQVSSCVYEIKLKLYYCQAYLQVVQWA